MVHKKLPTSPLNFWLNNIKMTPINQIFISDQIGTDLMFSNHEDWMKEVLREIFRANSVEDKLIDLMLDGKELNE